jgi:probable rRNA maturation factor
VASSLPEVSVAGRRLALPAATVRRLVRGVLAGERHRATISVTFLGRRAMQTLNKRWKGHDRPTDVISFALPGADGELVGDIYLCPDVAEREARRRALPLREELQRLVIHGTLHVLGWNHPNGAGRERSAMWRKQERYLERLG